MQLIAEFNRIIEWGVSSGNSKWMALIGKFAAMAEEGETSQAGITLKTHQQASGNEDWKCKERSVLGVCNKPQY